MKLYKIIYLFISSVLFFLFSVDVLEFDNVVVSMLYFIISLITLEEDE